MEMVVQNPIPPSVVREMELWQAMTKESIPTVILLRFGRVRERDGERALIDAWGTWLSKYNRERIAEA